MTEWRPISMVVDRAQAPWDGEPVLVCYRHQARWVYRIVQCRELISGNIEWLTFPGGWQCAPTHWQPLLPPPTPSAGHAS